MTSTLALLASFSVQNSSVFCIMRSISEACPRQRVSVVAAFEERIQLIFPQQIWDFLALQPRSTPCLHLELSFSNFAFRVLRMMGQYVKLVLASILAMLDSLRHGTLLLLRHALDLILRPAVLHVDSAGLVGLACGLSSALMLRTPLVSMS